MMIHWNRFNIYLVVPLALLLGTACQTEKSKRNKVFSTLRLHLEMNRETTGRSIPISVYHQHPVSLTVDKVPFLNETKVKEAKVVDAAGGFAIQIQFDSEGSMLLEQYTTGNRGRHMAIFSRFAMPADLKLNEGRWLAAPKISTNIKDGVLTFTPDASREEAEQIVLGLHNFANRVDHGPVLKW